MEFGGSVQSLDLASRAVIRKEEPGTAYWMPAGSSGAHGGGAHVDVRAEQAPGRRVQDGSLAAAEASFDSLQCELAAMAADLTLAATVFSAQKAALERQISAMRR